MSNETTAENHFSVERRTTIDPSTSISDYLLRHARETPDNALYRTKEGEGWKDHSAQ
nr:hypothetical protein [Actinomycetales bacterium]